MERGVPIVVGGVGGSGTRVIARLLQEAGVYIGGELGEALDNLWYAALFGRRSVFLDSREDLALLTDLFLRVMSAPQGKGATPQELRALDEIRRMPRIQHTPDEVDTWCRGLVLHAEQDYTPKAWGWKVPYSFLLIEHFLLACPDLRYVHLRRHGLDMAHSPNLNQLSTWGPLLLNREVELGPVDAFSYWCEVERRIERLVEQHPSRITIVDFENLTQDPHREVTRVLDSVALKMSDGVVERFTQWIQPPDSAGRFRSFPGTPFREQDLHYLQNLGMAAQ